MIYCLRNSSSRSEIEKRFISIINEAEARDNSKCARIQCNVLVLWICQIAKLIRTDMLCAFLWPVPSMQWLSGGGKYTQNRESSRLYMEEFGLTDDQITTFVSTFPRLVHVLCGTIDFATLDCASCTVCDSAGNSIMLTFTTERNCVNTSVNARLRPLALSLRSRARRKRCLQCFVLRTSFWFAGRALTFARRQWV